MAAYPYTNNHALGMPAKSVRAIMTILLQVGWTIGILIEASGPGFELYSQITLGALALYFTPRVLKDTAGGLMGAAKNLNLGNGD